MAIVGWVGAGMEVVVVRYVGQGHGVVGRMPGDAGALPESDVVTPDHIVVLVRSSR